MPSQRLVFSHPPHALCPEVVLILYNSFHIGNFSPCFKSYSSFETKMLWKYWSCSFCLVVINRSPSHSCHLFKAVDPFSKSSSAKSCFQFQWLQYPDGRTIKVPSSLLDILISIAFFPFLHFSYHFMAKSTFSVTVCGPSRS